MANQRRCSFLGLVACTVLGAPASLADDRIKQKGPEYQTTIRLDEALQLVDGVKLDPLDPDYCLKRRDICLAAECGGFEKTNVTRDCWKWCTERRYDRCLRDQR